MYNLKYFLNSKSVQILLTALLALVNLALFLIYDSSLTLWITLAIILGALTYFKPGWYKGNTKLRVLLVLIPTLLVGQLANVMALQAEYKNSPRIEQVKMCIKDRFLCQ